MTCIHSAVASHVDFDATCTALREVDHVASGDREVVQRDGEACIGANVSLLEDQGVVEQAGHEVVTVLGLANQRGGRERQTSQGGNACSGVGSFPGVHLDHACLGFAQHLDFVPVLATVQNVGAQRADNAVITGAAADGVVADATDQQVVAVHREVGAERGVGVGVVGNGGAGGGGVKQVVNASIDHDGFVAGQGLACALGGFQGGLADTGGTDELDVGSVQAVVASVVFVQQHFVLCVVGDGVAGWLTPRGVGQGDQRALHEDGFFTVVGHLRQRQRVAIQSCVHLTSSRVGVHEAVDEACQAGQESCLDVGLGVAQTVFGGDGAAVQSLAHGQLVLHAVDRDGHGVLRGEIGELDRVGLVFRDAGLDLAVVVDKRHHTVLGVGVLTQGDGGAVERVVVGQLAIRTVFVRGEQQHVLDGVGQRGVEFHRVLDRTTAVLHHQVTRTTHDTTLCVGNGDGVVDQAGGQGGVAVCHQRGLHFGQQGCHGRCSSHAGGCQDDIHTVDGDFDLAHIVLNQGVRHGVCGRNVQRQRQARGSAGGGGANAEVALVRLAVPQVVSALAGQLVGCVDVGLAPDHVDVVAVVGLARNEAATAGSGGAAAVHGAEDEGVDAITTGQQVVASTAFDGVVAACCVQDVDAGGAAQVQVAVVALEVLLVVKGQVRCGVGTCCLVVDRAQAGGDDVFHVLHLHAQTGIGVGVVGLVGRVVAGGGVLVGTAVASVVVQAALLAHAQVKAQGVVGGQGVGSDRRQGRGRLDSTERVGGEPQGVHRWIVVQALD